MISKAQKKKIVKVLGFRYVSPIAAELEVQGITNTKGEPHSNSMITNVMNGLNHEDIERAIFSAVKKKQQELQERKELLKQL